MPAENATSPEVVETDTVVVGASAAGLATAACLARAKVPCIVLEGSATVAAPWRRHYERLHLHSSRALSGLPHFPLPRRLPRFVPRAEMVAYLEAYAGHFGIAPRFSQQVLSISRTSDTWQTTTATTRYCARHVVLATGRLQTPHLPQWPGQDQFGGPLLHSAAYRTGAAYAGQRVLVVGMGNSGAEIALDLCEQGARVSLAVRSPVNVVPREFLGIPIDVWAVMLDPFPRWVGDAVGRVVRRLAFGSLSRLGLRARPYGPVTGMRVHGMVPTIDPGALARIRRGEITVLPDLTGFAPGAVSFVDGTTQPFDAVVLATGFRPGLGSLLGPGTEGVLDEAGLPRASGRAVLPGLYFCGYHLSLTGMLRRIARDARDISRSIASADLNPAIVRTRRPVALPAGTP